MQQIKKLNMTAIEELTWVNAKRMRQEIVSQKQEAKKEEANSTGSTHYRKDLN